jgi:AraC-like DNA-binding protein
MYSERPSRLPGGVLWSNSGLDPSSVVLPDGCTDLMFDGTRLLIAGPDTTTFTSALSNDRFVGLRMSSGIGPALWGVPGNALVNQRVPVVDLWPAVEVERLTAAVAAASDPGVVLEQIAARRWRANPPDRAMVDIAVTLRDGTPVAEVASQAGFSERQFHRRSLAAYGYGAKTLGRILRLNGALESARSGAAFASAAALWGYADQAHFSREVRALTGRTLTSLLRNGDRGQG